MNTNLDTMNREQRARFARSLYRRPALPRNAATNLFLKQLAGGAK